MFNSPIGSAKGSLRERLAPRASSSLGRPLVRDPFARSSSRISEHVPAQDPATIERSSSRTSTRSTSGEQRRSYRESGARWMERQEAQSLRKALEDMDGQEDQKIFADAQDEAAALVWKHQNPKAAERNPAAPYEYTAHLKKGSHARAQSYDVPSPLSSASGRNSSLSSHGSSSSSVKLRNTVIAEIDEKPKSKKEMATQKRASAEMAPLSPVKTHVSFELPHSSRRSSSGSKRKNSGSLFQNPNDKIYEEPEEPSLPPPTEQKPPPTSPSRLPIHTRRNPFSRVQMGRDVLNRTSTDPTSVSRKFDRFEIYRNTPTQSRNPGYTSNENAPATPTTPNTPAETSPQESPVKMKDGKEIRTDDIRAATSMKIKDRSAKLPTPTMVSDSPGRPIVSFQSAYKPKEIELKEEQSRALPEAPSSHPKSYPPSPPKTSSVPVVPTINMPDAPFGKPKTSAAPPIPVINIPDEPPRAAPRRGSAATPPIPSIYVPDAPSINVSSAPSINVSSAPSISINNSSPRPLPTINAPASAGHSARPLPNPRAAPGIKGRPLPRHTSTAPSQVPHTHVTPTGGARTSALCEACALPIAGRTVSAAGARFHPECFRCHHCSEALECVAFYPEPNAKRAERVERIARRRDGDEEVEGGEEEDGDEGMRFYCHLDYHEFFSPRCKSCKTPIEGEVIVACGAEWHVGHFFCAECGDVSFYAPWVGVDIC